MIVTAGKSPVADDLGPRLSDSGKARDQSPVRRLLGSSSLQQLQQHLTRRSSSPLGRPPTVSTTAGAAAALNSPRSSSASPLVASAIEAQAVSLAVQRTNHTASPVPGAPPGLASPAPAAPAATSTADAVQGAQEANVQPSPVVMPDEAVAAGSAEASLTQHLAGKRKVRGPMHDRRTSVRTIQVRHIVHL